MGHEGDGFVIWAVVLKETNEMIGQCGLTMLICISVLGTPNSSSFSTIHSPQKYSLIRWISTLLEFAERLFGQPS